MSSRPPESERTSGDQARQELHKARQEAGQYASEAAQAAERRGREEIEKAQRGAADRTEQLADAIDRTADEIGSPDDPLSGYGHSMASMMRRFAGGLRENDIEDFASELSQFAKRSPGMFLAGSVALGFGLSRFMKASTPRAGSYDYRDEDYGFDAEDYMSEEEFGTDEEMHAELYVDDELGDERSGDPLRSSTTDVGGHGSAEGAGQSSERWPEDRANRGAASEYSAGATGQPAGTAGEPEAMKRASSGDTGGAQTDDAEPQRNEPGGTGGTHRE